MKTTDLTIIGAGELGGRAGRLWREKFPDAKVSAETTTSVRHGSLLRWGLNPRLRAHRDDEKFAHVIFAVPSSAPKYTLELKAALAAWNREGKFVMISSTGVFAEDGGQDVDEDGGLATTPRAERLVEAENEVLVQRGMVIRMAGLYCLNRGPHRSYLNTALSTLEGDGLINLIHYEDAATLAVAALLKGTEGMTYLGTDGTPTSRADLARLAAEHFKSTRKIDFTGKEPSLGKRCHNERTRKLLDWRPQFDSFEDFLKRCSGLPPDIA